MVIFRISYTAEKSRSPNPMLLAFLKDCKQMQLLSLGSIIRSYSFLLSTVTDICFSKLTQECASISIHVKQTPKQHSLMISKAGGEITQ